MSYNQTAERYSVYNGDGSLFVDVMDCLYYYHDDGKPFRLSSLINKCEKIKHYHVNTQSEILRVVMRDACRLPPECDGFERLQGSRYLYVYRPGIRKEQA